MTNIDKIKEQAKSLEALSGLDANKSHGIFSSLLQWVSFIWRDMENMFQEHVKQVENLLQNIGCGKMNCNLTLNYLIL